jgi:hypothetical protein
LGFHYFWSVRQLFLSALVLAAPFSCHRRSKAADPTVGTLDVEWTGSATGRFVAEASGLWCPADSLLELTAIRGDTGVGIALAATDTLRLGQHPVVLPSVPVGWRPLARAAIRWITKTESKGFEGAGGNVHLTDLSGSRVSGRVDARMKGVNQRDTLRVVGTFTRVPFTRNPAPCGRMAKGGAG